MYKTFKALLTIIWLIDIFNINFMIGDTNIAYFLDNTLPINGWLWFFIWLLIPSSVAYERSLNKND